MPSLESLYRDLEWAEVKWRDQTVKVGWRPAALTSEALIRFQNQINDLPDDAPVTAAVPLMAGLLIDIIAEWDLTEKDGGPPLPITTESLMKLPSDLLISVRSSILDSTSPGESEGTSPDTSQQTVASVRSLPGTGSFERHAG